MYRKIATLPDGGGEVTPLQDIAIETGRPPSSVKSKIDELGLKIVRIRAPTKNAKNGRVMSLMSVPSQDVPALIDLITQMRRVKFAHRRGRDTNGVQAKPEAPAPKPDQRTGQKKSYDRQQALVDLKAAIQLLRDEAGLKSLKWDDGMDGIELRWDRTDVLKV